MQNQDPRQRTGGDEPGLMFGAVLHARTNHVQPRGVKHPARSVDQQIDPAAESLASPKRYIAHINHGKELDQRIQTKHQRRFHISVSPFAQPGIWARFCLRYHYTPRAAQICYRFFPAFKGDFCFLTGTEIWIK